MQTADKDIRRILIVQTAFIGDVILVTPLIRAVKQLYPQAKLDVMLIPTAAPLLKNNPHINELILFDKNGSKTSFFKTALRLRRNKYDLAISPHSSFTTHLLLWLSGASMRIGYARGFLSRWLMTDQVPHPKGIHKILKNLSLLNVLTNKQFSMQTELFPGSENIAEAQTILSELGGGKTPLLALAPGSIWKTKCWSLDCYKELALNLVSKGFRVVLIGGDADREKCQVIISHINEQAPQSLIINAAGRSGLLTSAALLKQADLLICNDSGALHIANALQTRVYAIFGPTLQSIGYYPFREGDHVFEVDLPCRPCGSHGGNKCPLKHHNCMKQIKPKDVLAKVLETLNNEDGVHE